MNCALKNSYLNSNENSINDILFLTLLESTPSTKARVLSVALIVVFKLPST